MDIESLKKILSSLRRFSKKSTEFTIEANPESTTTEKLSLFLDEGVNRISIGAQSFDGPKLNRLGRLHNGPDAVGAITKASKIGFKNIGVDLIFGVWDESLSGWEKDLKIAVNLPIKHISCYGLTYEQGTPIKESVKNGSIVPVSEDVSADMYDMTISYLADRGFAQYEISNFSMPGFSCKHNHVYWNNDPYIGLGPSAVSYTNGIRTENVSNISVYIDKVRSGVRPIGSSEKLSPIKSAKETAAVKIRTIEGIGFDWFNKKTGFKLPDLEKDVLPKLISDGLIEYNDPGSAVQGLHLTRRGILLCDTVSSAFL